MQAMPITINRDITRAINSAVRSSGWDKSPDSNRYRGIKRRKPMRIMAKAINNHAPLFLVTLINLMAKNAAVN
jgi:hypothetical protein